MRKTTEELDAIKKKYKVNTLYSWSRISSWHTSKYEWFLNYILNEPMDRNDSIYGTTGNMCHDIIEEYYLGKIKYEDMINEFNDSWDMSRNIMQLKFDRNNEEQDKKIGDRYFENVSHFFKHHQPIKYDIHTEDFALIQIDKNILIGYIDAWHKDDNGDIWITDWKTSSIYKGETLIEKSGQLMCYAMYFYKNGIPLGKIHAQFNFLKYCNIIYEQANGKTKCMSIERRLLGEKLQSPCKMWLKKFGYEPDDYLKNILDNADLNILPVEVQDKINISDCYVEIPITEEGFEYWITMINNTIDEIEYAEDTYSIMDDDTLFHDDIEHIKNESYYFANLSGYSSSKNIDYQKYLKELEDKEKGLDFFK